MGLEFWALPTANDWFMISEDREVPAIDLRDEMSHSMFDSHQFSYVGRIALLFRPERFAPESKWFPVSVSKLIQRCSQADLAGIS